MDINPTGAAVTANAIGNATTLGGTSRIYASCTSASTVFIVNADNGAIGSFHMNAGNQIICRKRNTDKIYANSASVIFTPIGF